MRESECVCVCVCECKRERETGQEGSVCVTYQQYLMVEVKMIERGLQRSKRAV